MTLRTLLQSMTLEEFLERYWEKESLHVCAEDKGRFDELTDAIDITDIIWSSCRSWGDVSLAKSGVNYGSVDYGNQQPSVELIRMAFKDGFTVVINDLQKKCRPIARLCRSIESELFCRANINLYLSNRCSQGLDAHYDDDDVVIIQLIGSKEWTLYGSSEYLPLRDDDYVPPVSPNPYRTILMNTGDVLYLPRGTVHAARTLEDSTSMHITISLRTLRWLDLYQAHVTTLARENPILRRSLPLSLIKFSQNFNSIDVVNQSVFQAGMFKHMGETLNMIRSQLIFGAEAIPGETATLDLAVNGHIPGEYIRSPSSISAFQESDHAITICCTKGVLEFPLSFSESLRFIMDRESFHRDELPGNTLEGEKEALLKHLVECGLLEPRVKESAGSHGNRDQNLN